MDVSPIISSSIMQPGLFGTASVQPVTFLLNSSATAAASSVDIVDISGLGQLLSASSIFETGILKAAATNQAGFSTVVAATQFFVDAFNSFLQSDSLQSSLGGSLGNLFTQMLNTQTTASSSDEKSIIASLSGIGINFQAPTSQNTTGLMTINFETLQSAFNTDQLGTVSLLAQTTQSIGQLAAEFTSLFVQMSDLTQNSQSLPNTATLNGLLAATADTGTTATTGTNATTGTTATTGTNATTGTTAAAGTTATAGANATTGTTATAGANATTGTTAATGVNAITGTTAATGANAITGTTAATGTTVATEANATIGTTAATETIATAGTNAATGANAITGTTAAAGTTAATEANATIGTTAAAGINAATRANATTGTTAATETIATAGTAVAAGINAATRANATTGTTAATETIATAGTTVATGINAATRANATTGTIAATETIAIAGTTAATEANAATGTTAVTGTTVGIIDATNPAVAAAIAAYHVVDGIFDSSKHHGEVSSASFPEYSEIRRVAPIQPVQLDLYA